MLFILLFRFFRSSVNTARSVTEQKIKNTWKNILIIRTQQTREDQMQMRKM